jgi:hypothetical protein
MANLAALVPLTFFLAMSSTAFSAGEQPIVSTAAEQGDVAITIYNDNLGLVRETRMLALAAGRNEVRYMDVASQINPRTVHIISLTNPQGLQVLEQNYEYDLISPEKLMEKFVGRRVRLVFPPSGGDRSAEREMDATLVSTTGGMVYQIGNEFHVNPPARVILPEIPGGLISVPTLVWLLNSTGQAQRSATKVETSYLTGGIGWSADYVGVVSADDAKADLAGWVTIDNTSGASYKDAHLQLVAGDVHRAPPAAMPMMERMDAGGIRAKQQFAEESLFEYHLYTLDRPATLKDHQTKQIALFEAAGVPVKKIFLLSGQTGWFQMKLGAIGTDMKVAVMLELTNSQKNGLGIPLPRGTVRLYKKDSSGGLQFIGEDNIAHTPKDEKITMKMGDAFDVVADRTQTDYRAVSAGRFDTESEFEIKIRNHKSEPVTVVVREPVPGDWKVLTSTYPWTKADAHTIEFSVPVAANAESILRYRVSLDLN